MTTAHRIALARALGVVDGYADGAAFGVGYSWPAEHDDCNGAYDEGVNLGQALAAEEGR